MDGAPVNLLAGSESEKSLYLSCYYCEDLEVRDVVLPTTLCTHREPRTRTGT